MSTQTVQELQETIQPLRDVRECPNLHALDAFFFIEQDVNEQERIQRLSVVASQMELTAAHIRRLLELPS